MPTDTQSNRPAQYDGLAVDPTAAGILDSLGLGLLVVDAGGVIRHANAIATARLPVGEDMEAVFGPARFVEPFDGWSKEIPRIIKTGASVRLACVWPASGGESPHGTTLRCRPLHSGRSDSVTGVVILIEEETEQDLFERRLEMTQRLASLGKLATRVAHELNNPLDGILRYVNLAIRVVDNSPEPRLKSYLTESRTGLMRMVQIIGDLLQFSRTTDGAFDEVTVNEVVEQAIRATASAADANRVVVAADFHSQSMPSVRGGRLYQVLCNLIRNSIDAMPTGGRLTITTGVVDDAVLIEVADTGVGLPANTDELFEPFFTTKDAGRGTGLGLAICKDFIQDMNGTITASPGTQGGAVFTVRLPAGHEHAAAPPAGPSHADPAPSSVRK